MRSASQSSVVRRRRTVERKRFLRLKGVRVARSLCAHCGRLAVRPLARPGRTMLYRTLLAFPVPVDCAIPTCSRCQSEYIGTEERQRLDVLLAPLYERELTHRLQLALKEVLTVISQRKLELRTHPPNYILSPNPPPADLSSPRRQLLRLGCFPLPWQ